MAYNTLGPWRVENLGTENKMCVTNTSWCFLLDNSLWLGSCEVLGRGPIHFRQRAIRIGVHGHGGGTGSKPCSLLGLLENFFRNNKTPTPFRYLTKLSMFIRSGGKYPNLRGKASEIRHFGKALLALWNQFSNQALLLHRRIALMLKHNVHLEDMILITRKTSPFPRVLPRNLRKPQTECYCFWLRLQTILLKKAWKSSTLHRKAICFKNWLFWVDASIPKSFGALWGRTRCNECNKSPKLVFVETRLTNKLQSWHVTTGWPFTYIFST